MKKIEETAFYQKLTETANSGNTMQVIKVQAERARSAAKAVLARREEAAQVAKLNYLEAEMIKDAEADQTKYFDNLLKAREEQVIAHKRYEIAYNLYEEKFG